MKKTFLAINLALLTTVSAFSQKGALKLNLKEGQKYEYSFSANQDIELSMMGMDMKMDQLMNFTYNMVVEKANADNTFEVKNTISRIQMTQNMEGMGSSTYDSNSPESASGMAGETFADMFGKMKGLTYTLTVDQQGEIVKSNYEELLAGLGAEGTGSIVANEPFFIKLPKDALKKGYSWSTDLNSFSQGVETVNKTKYTVTSADKDKIVISYTNTVEPVSSSNEDGEEIVMNGSGSGTIELDAATGLVIKNNSVTNIDMVATQQGMSMPMKIKSTNMIGRK
jgi:hypothetical protein